MLNVLSRPKPLVAALLFLSAIPIVMATVRLYQIPAGQLPMDAIKFTVVPWTHFAHALAGALFGILGPLQFAGVLKRKFGAFHRMTGRIFIVAGLALSVSALRLLWQFPGTSTPVLDLARLVTGAGLAAALVTALVAIKRREVARHKAWMIRAYAVGMGSATISFIMFPIFLITGEPPVGLVSDLLFVASWVINIGIGEWVIRRPMARRGTAMAA